MEMNSVVFDLDGTLIDSAPDIHASVNRMLAAESHQPLDLPTITCFIGNGLPNLVARVMKTLHIDMAEHTRLTAATLAQYHAAPADLTLVYPGVTEALTELRNSGHRLGVCTNKPEAPAREILSLLNLAQHFDVIIGGDSLPTRKPDPAMLTASFDALGSPGTYVGDSEVDAETAHRAGADFLLFTQGYCHVPFDQLPHRAMFDHFDMLPALVAPR